MDLSLINKVLKTGAKALTEPEAKEFIKSLGILIPDSKVVKDLDEAKLSSKTLGYPLALKIVSRQILHKSDIGGVVTGIRDERELEGALMEVSMNVAGEYAFAGVEGFLLEKMAPKGTEVIVGAIRDSQFGPAVMAGIGGIAVEFLKDFSFRLAPVTVDEALSMLKELKSYPLLTGARGESADLNAIADTIVKVSCAISEASNINEMEINPLIVYERGCVAVDARIVLK